MFRALACDYDGTLATGDRIAPSTLAALERARAAGVRLVLVTGRTFFELTRVCERLDVFDAVVAENGGVLYFPPSGVLQDQAPAPPARLVAELDRQAVAYQLGRVVVGFARGDEGRVRKTLQSTGVRMELVANRAALMALPVGVSKGSGVRQVVRTLGLSSHDVLGVGDAENDLDLFAACGWTACPENAVPELKARADWVFPGDDGSAVAAAIDRVVLGGGQPAAARGRHRLMVGWATDTLEPVTIPERGVNVIVQGDSLSGKSWLVGVLVERLLDRRYAVCVLDPEGDFHVLGELPGVDWVPVRDRDGAVTALDRFEDEPSGSVILDLSELGHGDKVRAIERVLARVRRLRESRGVPHWVVIEEAHYSLHPEGVAGHLIGAADKGFCLVTYRASWLRESIAGAGDLFVLARTTIPTEIRSLAARLSDCVHPGPGVVSLLPRLTVGQYVLVEPGATDHCAVTFVALPRLTRHVRHRRKYADGRVPPERCFFFRSPDGGHVGTAGSLGGFLRAVERLDDAVLADHAGRGDFSRWVRDVFDDRLLARQLGAIERRWRSAELRDLRHALERLLSSALRRVVRAD